MVVKVITSEANDYGEGESLSIETPKYGVSFGDMEPEDAYLARDLSCAYSIEYMIQEAFNAGKKGETLEFLYSNPDD